MLGTMDDEYARLESIENERQREICQMAQEMKCSVGLASLIRDLQGRVSDMERIIETAFALNIMFPND